MHITYILVLYNFDFDIFFPSIIVFFLLKYIWKRGLWPPIRGTPMNIQSGAYDFRNLHKITNKMVYDLFGHDLNPRYLLTAPDYTHSSALSSKHSCIYSCIYSCTPSSTHSCTQILRGPRTPSRSCTALPARECAWGCKVTYITERNKSLLCITYCFILLSIINILNSLIWIISMNI